MSNILDEILHRNFKKDPRYAPYCMRCTGLVRMIRTGEKTAKCKCGAKFTLPEENSDENSNCD
jgi:hypothetical protein